jgi:glycosyltransferase involved in cell wall biosynthesis
VLFYGRPSSDRRAFELGILSLVQVAKAHPDVEFILVGGDLDGFVIPFRHRCEGVLDFQELAALYNECDIALVLSMTNASLLPIELMACGVPVVSNRAPWTEWLLRDAVAELAAPTVQGIAAAVSRLLDDPLRRAQLREAGLAAAEATSWDEEGDRMASILRTME